MTGQEPPPCPYFGRVGHKSAECIDCLIRVHWLTERSREFRLFGKRPS